MKKRVAVQFFGNTRTYKDCYKSLNKNIFDLYDCDIFMHTWETIDHNTKTWHKHKIKTNKNNTVEEKTLRKYYPKIKKITIESTKDLDFNLDGEFHVDHRTFSLLGVRCMYHSMEMVNNLRINYEIDNGKQYDYIILIRSDLYLRQPLVLEDYTEFQKLGMDNAIFTSKLFGEDSIINEESITRGLDLIVFSTPKSMNNLFKNNNLTKYLNEVKNKKVNNGPEQFICKLANDNNLKVRVTNYSTDTSFEVVRSVSRLSLKNFISLRIRKKMVKLSLFPRLNNIIKLSFSLLNGTFVVYFTIGKINQERI